MLKKKFKKPFFDKKWKIWQEAQDGNPCNRGCLPFSKIDLAHRGGRGGGSKLKKRGGGGLTFYRIIILSPSQWYTIVTFVISSFVYNIVTIIYRVKV